MEYNYFEEFGNVKIVNHPQVLPNKKLHYKGNAGSVQQPDEDFRIYSYDGDNDGIVYIAIRDRDYMTRF